jgi:surfactin synthase thioesterase subunit
MTSTAQRKPTPANSVREGWVQPVQLANSRCAVTLKKATKDPKIRLICLPYAGGGTGVFRSWADGVDDSVELMSVVLPGHGSRIDEPPYEAWGPLLADTFTAVAPYLAEPHAFYGHSFGGRLAYELAHMARTERGSRTRHLFISSCRCPASPQTRPYLHQLSDSEFLAALRSSYGAPREIVRDRTLMEPKLAALRSDIKLAELWNDGKAQRLTIPITAIYGEDDMIDNQASMSGWPDYSEAGGELIGIPGGHFLVDTNTRRILEIINARLHLAHTG